MIRDIETVRDETASDPVVGGTETRTEFRTAERIASGSTNRVGDGRSITDLLKELRDESSRLVRQEVALAKTELSEKTAKLGRNAGYAGAGGALAHAGLILLMFGLAALAYVGLVALDVNRGHAGWIAPVGVGLIAVLIGYGLIQKAVSTFKRESLVPEKTVESMKENQRWLQDKATA